MQLKYDTPEARSRGQMYVEEAQRQEIESEYEGRKEEFLKSLGMVAYPRLATRNDLKRIAELVTRTNQFNSTGIRYTDAEIETFLENSDYDFYITSLEDKFGEYGRCGVALIRKDENAWNVEILLVSCRVAGRGLGTAFLSYLSDEARKAGGKQFLAKYVKTDKNRQIGLLYKILGFAKDAERSDEKASVFSFDLSQGGLAMPGWIRVEPNAARTEER
jgi:FkbH-like protein